jgi:virginiamycin A acetyltransferase
VVTRDVPDYAIVAGNPAVTVRMRFDPDSIDRLVKAAWWDWEPSKVRRNLGLLLSTDVEAFLRDAI